MRSFQTTISNHELTKYLQLLPVTDSNSQSPRTNAAPLSFRLSECSTLHDALTMHMELLRLRLRMFTRL
jgi:hypothetical protein